MYPEDAGAGGSWPRIDERVDPSVIRQECEECCGAACGQMLLNDLGISVEQRDIVDLIGVPMDAVGLATVMNRLDPVISRRWKGGGGFKIPGATPRELIETLINTGSWVAVLRAKMGHMVIVDGIDTRDRLWIRDPWEGTRYHLKFSEFINYWKLEGVFKLI